MKTGIYTKQNQALCEWLRACREQKGLTVREVAARLGTSHSRIVRVENGGLMLNLVQFVAWAVALQVNPHDVIDKLWVIEMDEQTHAMPPSWERTNTAVQAPQSAGTRRMGGGAGTDGAFAAGTRAGRPCA
jgi:transcriptional regulator with XRE-family HTH domain